MVRLGSRFLYRRHRAIGRRGGPVLVTLATVAGLLGSPAGALAATPIDGGPITIYPVSINSSAGDQYDPHVDGDLVSYTSVDKIRFYDFFTSNDAQVPASPANQDLLSDVSNGRIVFTRLSASGFSPMLFEVASNGTTPIDPQPTSDRFNTAIGADTVAFIDEAVAPEGELFITSIGGPSTRISTDARADREPQVAPAGSPVVYQSCGPGCDIRQAAWNGSSWVVTSLTANAEEERNPDTDGTVVVYDAIRSGEQDIAWQPVGGGPEQRLDLPGEQRNPSVRGGLISFESLAVGEIHADLFLYQISTNRLFRITSTPDNDNLNDISALGDGRVRLVWSAGEEGSRDVYGATLELPPVGPIYDFGGFVAPVDPRPTLNSMKAGGAVPVKFSLGGNQGLSIFTAGYPRSQAIACDTTADVDGVEQTVNAGGSSLAYDPSTDTYTYVWKTDRAWANTCRQLVLAFADGSVQRVNFKFK